MGRGKPIIIGINTEHKISILVREYKEGRYVKGKTIVLFNVPFEEVLKSIVECLESKYGGQK